MAGNDDGALVVVVVFNLGIRSSLRGPSSMGRNVEKVVNQGGLRLTLLGEEFSDLEFFYTAMPNGLPFVPDEQPLRFPIKDEMPAISE